MSQAQRHTEPIDVHLILRRESEAGPQVLLSRRAGPVYASGLWHLPSGHLDGAHEDVVAALVREAQEETGVLIAPDDVRAALTLHHRSPGGSARVGVFFEVRDWRGVPGVSEPSVCDAMGWYLLEALPDPMVAYCRAGLDAYRAGCRIAVHFQQPGDSIAYDPSADRLHLVSDPELRRSPAGFPTAAVRRFTEQAVGRITTWTDTSWAREGSRVWRADGASGSSWYLKVHHNERFHYREVAAYRAWVPRLGPAAPRLVAADEHLRAIIVTAVPGRPLFGAAHTPPEQHRIFHRIGALAAAVHRSAPPLPAGGGPVGAKMERHLDAARPRLRPGDEDFVRSLVQGAAQLPGLERVPTHGDFQLRNLLSGADGTLYVIDFERSELAPAIRDLVRLSDAWSGRPDLYEAFLAGYGRRLTPLEEKRLTLDAALDAVSGIAFAARYADPELLERGRRTLARLRAADRPDTADEK